MQFLPRPSSKEGDLEQLLADLKLGLSFRLLHLLNHRTAELPALLDTLITARHEISWIFSDTTMEELLASKVSGEPARLLNLYFQFDKRMRTSPGTYYLRQGEILWGRYFGDLAQLGVNSSDPLFINLKNYLDWGRYQPELNNHKIIAKIFWPLLLSLRADPRFPPAFLSESRAILLTLYPQHTEAVLELANELLATKKPNEALSLLRSALRFHQPQEELILDVGLIRHLFALENTLDRSRLQADAETLFGYSASGLDKVFWKDCAKLLYDADLIVPAFFYLLKGLSYQSSELQGTPLLRKILWGLDHGLIAERLTFDSPAKDTEPEILVFIDPELRSRIRVKPTGAQKFLPPKSNHLFLQSGQMGGVQVQIDQESTGVFLFPGPSPYQKLFFKEGKCVLQKISPEVPSSGNPHLKFADFEFQVTLDNIKRITPFQFFRRGSNVKPAANVHSGV